MKIKHFVAIQSMMYAMFALLFLQPSTVVAQATAQDMAAPPTLTQAQVIKVATDFCQKIGQPVTAQPATTFPEPLIIWGDTYWQPQWNVTFPGQAEIHIADPTGVVTFYDNNGYYVRNSSDRTPPGPAIPQEQADQIAQNVLKATGANVAEFGNREDKEHQNAAELIASQHFWYIGWDRLFHNIRYYAQGCDVTLDAQTGEVIVAKMVLPSPPVTNAQLNVTQEQAIALTQTYMVKDLGFQGTAALRRAEMQIVQPQTEWDSAPNQAVGHLQTARPAWVVRYLFVTPTGQHSSLDTWIDTQTGALIGVESAGGPMGGQAVTAPPKPPTPLAQLLPTIEAVYARRADAAAKSGWAAIKSAALTAKKQPQQIAALKTAKPAAAPAILPADQLVLVGKDNSLTVYGYDPATGKLGAGTDWLTVPSSFRVWMQKRLSGTRTSRHSASG
jgi:hypothetical protein